MKKYFSVLVFLFLIAAGCNQAQPLIQNRTKEEKNPSTTNQYMQTDKKPIAKLDTSNWKTYSDNKISFKYPDGWKIRTGKLKDRIYLSLIDLKKEYSIEESPISPIVISYWPDKFGGFFVPGKKEKIKGEAGEILQKDTMLIGGRQAYIRYGSAPPVFINERLVFTNGFEFTLGSNGQNLLATNGNKVTQQIDDIFETILSTVNFLQTQ